MNRLVKNKSSFYRQIIYKLNKFKNQSHEDLILRRYSQRMNYFPLLGVALFGGWIGSILFYIHIKIKYEEKKLLEQYGSYIFHYTPWY